MLRILFSIGVFFALSCSSVSLAQSAPAAPATPATGADTAGDTPANDGTDPTKPVKEGIRFVFKDSVPEDTNVYMPLGKGKTVKLKISKGVPSNRLPFPLEKKITLYDRDPYTKASAPNSKPVLLGGKQVPPEIGSKVLCILVPTQSGLTLEFVDEAKLALGDVFIRNLTTQELGLRVSKSDQTPLQVIQLAPGEEQKFAPGRNAPGNGKSNVYPTQLCRKNEKGEWYVLRQIVLEVPYFGAEIMMFNWNELNKMPEVQKITIRPDRVVSPNAGKEPAAGPNNRAPREPRTPAPAGGK